MYKYILYPDKFFDDDFSIEKKFLKNKYKLVGLKLEANQLKKNEIGLLNNASALVMGISLQVNKKIISMLSKCSIITRAGVGYDLIDIEECKTKNIPVCNVPDYGTDEVADHSFAMILNFSRGISYYNDLLSQNLKANWNYSAAKSVVRLSKKKIGILGLGRIGIAVALRAKAFGLDVVFYDPYIDDGYDKALNIKREKNLINFIKEINFLSINCSANRANHEIINSKILKHANKNLVIVNTARGKLVDLDAIYWAIKNNEISCYGTDVFEKEPPEKDNLLIKAFQNKEDWLLGRLIISPHAAFYSPDSIINLREKAIQTCINHIEKLGTFNCINGL